ncbi:MAG: hypothetical protein EXR69_02195 [Myxococcales bacterium]|nr:hypothetical protein [Myxococcales bacterium]
MPFFPLLAVLGFPLTGCIDNSDVPDDALVYTVTVTGIGPDTCHPGNEEGWEEVFEYAVAFDASAASIYANGEVFAAGSLSGCNLSYQTVVIGEDDRAEGALKWQLTGTAKIETDGATCVDGDAEWAGTETYTVIATEDDTMEAGCTYPTTTVGEFIPAAD